MMDADHFCRSIRLREEGFTLSGLFGHDGDSDTELFQNRPGEPDRDRNWRVLSAMMQDDLGKSRNAVVITALTYLKRNLLMFRRGVSSGRTG